MNNNVVVTPNWSTASFGNAADMSPIEFTALGMHLDLCNRSRGGLFALQHVAKTMCGFVTGHFVTTLAVVALLIGVSSLMR